MGEQEEERVLAYINVTSARRSGGKNGRPSPIQVNEIESAVDKIEARGGVGGGRRGR